MVTTNVAHSRMTTFYVQFFVKGKYIPSDDTSNVLHGYTLLLTRLYRATSMAACSDNAMRMYDLLQCDLVTIQLAPDFVDFSSVIVLGAE